jgi:nitrite reductase/ring-hydroxylating ferredoxin subunit
MSDSKGADPHDLQKLCEISAVAEGDIVRVEIEGFPPLAVYHSEGEFFVSDDVCSHGEASLADGYLEGTEIECPWHGGKFCIRTGRALTFPAVTAIQVYRVTIEAGILFISPSTAPVGGIKVSPVCIRS